MVRELELLMVNIKAKAKDLVPSGSEVGRVLTSAIPYAGGPLLEIANIAANRRMSEFCRMVENQISELQKHVTALSWEKLQENDAFISACFTGCSMALRTHSTEKLEALRNALINSALIPSADDVKKAMFLQLVDVFTEVHIQVLRILRDPGGEWNRAGAQGGDKAILLRVVLWGLCPNLDRQEELTGQILNDLLRRGLIRETLRDSVLINQRIDGSSLLSSLGNEFLKFITLPGSDG